MKLINRAGLVYIEALKLNWAVDHCQLSDFPWGVSNEEDTEMY